MFVCGPTVYDYAHIGHARTYFAFDAFARYLRSRDFPVFYLQNITDIDDKIIERAGKLNQSPEDLARTMERLYLRDMKQLGISSVNRYARATQFIPKIVSQIRTLIKKGYAYEVPESGWYFDIARFKDYGKLSKRTVAQAEDAISRVDEAHAKRNKGDFVLWKFVSVQEHLGKKRDYSRVIINSEPAWNTSLGWGRPGWHIEDTAISEHFFGPQYDLHGGAHELTFPHHEAEIAQQEAASGKKPFVKTWMHTGLLRINNEKMSKSLGNFVTIKEFLEHHPALLLRWLTLSHHYRSSVNYTEKTLQQAEDSLRSLTSFLARLHFVEEHAPRTSGRILPQTIFKRFEQSFHTSLEDDFNTGAAFAAIFSFIDSLHKKIWNCSRGEAKKARLLITRLLESLGITIPISRLPQSIEQKLKKRELCRDNKQFVQADSLRKELLALGYEVEDTPLGPFAWKQTWQQRKN